MTSSTPTQIVLTASEVADLLGYKPDTVRRLVRSGHLPGPIDDTINPKLWRWSATSVRRYIDDGGNAA
jgi:predicted DNA-binding transcriptional regulator AlpA